MVGIRFRFSCGGWFDEISSRDWLIVLGDASKQFCLPGI